MSHPEFIPESQMAYRRQVIGAFGVQAGWSVLEVGCGQGEMTFALAEAVGAEGHVLAIDSAGPEYGAPTSLGEAHRQILAGPTTHRIEFRLNCSIHDLPSSQRFDAVIFCHSSWYFADDQELQRAFAKATELSHRLLVAEWELMPRTKDQRAHEFAIRMQKQAKHLIEETQSNVTSARQTIRLIGLLQDAGWHLETKVQLETSALADADWEIRAAKDAIFFAPPSPERERFIEMWNQAATDMPSLNNKGNVPLPAVALIASR